MVKKLQIVLEMNVENVGNSLDEILQDVKDYFITDNCFDNSFNATHLSKFVVLSVKEIANG